MKKILYIKDSIDNKLTYYHVLLFLLMLPFDRFYSTIILVSFIVHSLLFLTKNKIRNINSWWLIPSSVFFVTLLGSTYALVPARGLDIVSKQLAILFFPLLVSIAMPGIKKYRNRLLMGFSIGCVATIVYLFLDALYTILFYRIGISSLFSSAFINHNFSLPIGMHATYLSMLLLLAFVFLLKELFDRQQESHENNSRSLHKEKMYIIVGLLIIMVGLIQLSSKSVLFTLLLIANTVFPFFVLAKKARRKFLLVSITISVLLLVSILSVDSYRNRYMNTLKEDLAKNTAVVIENSRVDRWKAAMDLIKQSPVIGTGSGTEIPLLKDLYFDRKMYVSYIESLNAHNQYLSFLINNGAIGLLIYLATIYWGFRQAFKTRDVMYVSFMLLIAIVSFSEDILDVNKGIFFYAFFFSFFSINNSTGFPNILINRQPLFKKNVYKRGVFQEIK